MAYDELKAAAAKFSNAELLDEMDKHALALTVLWREAERREQPEWHGVEGLPVMEDKKYGKKLFVSVGMSDRRGFHISAVEGEIVRR